MHNFVINLAGVTRAERIISYTLWPLLTIALVGSILAAFGICSGGCTDAANYRLFGLQFATVGIPFFVAVAIVSSCRNDRRFRYLFDVLLAGAAGAEYLFIYIQKHLIGHYCPVCLVIAAAVVLAATLRLVEVTTQACRASTPAYKFALYAILMFCTGFGGLTLAVAGTTNPADTTAKTGTISQDIWLAGPASPSVEVYFVTDWFCDYCRKAEPAIEAMLPAVGRAARYTFIDKPIHQESLNFTPFHASLLLNDKPHYLSGRKALLELATKTTTPGEELVRNAFAQQGLTLRMADYATVVGLTTSTTGFLRANGVTMTPSVVIRNRMTGERRTLSGVENIGEGIVLMTIKRLQGK